MLGASLALAPLVAAQAPKLKPNPKVAVVAVRDSRLLTLCPVLGKDVIESNFWQSDVRARVAVAYPIAGMQRLGFHFEDSVRGNVLLPVASTEAGPPTATTPDAEAKAEIEAALRARTRYAVVDAAEADFVLIVESSFVSMNELRRPAADQPAPGSTPGAAEWGIEHRTLRQLALGVLVPATAYREHPTDTRALVAARAWEGMTFAEWRSKDGVPVTTAASLPGLVDQLNGKGRQHPAYLPVCTVNGGAPY